MMRKVKLFFLRWLVAWGRMVYGLLGVVTLGFFLGRPGWVEVLWLDYWLGGSDR